MESPIRIVQYGLGPIGLEAASTVLRKQGTGSLHLVGAVDIDPAKVGRDLAELLGEQRATGIRVQDDADRVLVDARPDVVLHTTRSFLPDVREQLLRCARAGVHVVSSTEELAFPFERYPELAAELDQVARRHGAVILGTGVNPGFAMDTLALTATAPCTEVSSIFVERVVDAGRRRGPLQRKVGAGLTVEAFRKRAETGTFGHIGLRESLLLVAGGLGWTLDRIEETLDPIVAERSVTTPVVEVQSGQVAGIHHVVNGFAGSKTLLTLDLKMYVGAENPRDVIRVDGTPPIHLSVQDGIFGDTATVAALINAVPKVLELPPGLRTMNEVSVPRAFATRATRQEASAAVR